MPGSAERTPLIQLTPEQTFARQREREVQLSRLVMLYAGTGLLFMLLPGTFLGVWNLISISTRHAALSVSPSWIQAHGHAQIFGWIGTFILGIGYHSIPKLRRMESFALSLCWATWALWTTGVLSRWLANVYLWHWRLLLPVSAGLELIAFVLFFHTVSGHKQPSGRSSRFEPWVLLVITGTLGFAVMVLVNAGAATWLALYGSSPAFPHEFDQKYLVLSTWGFMVPFVWGFSAKWLPVFLGLRQVRAGMLLCATAMNIAAVIAAMFGSIALAVAIPPVSVLFSMIALRLFESGQQAPKVKGVHASFPIFVRLAYMWLGIAAALGVWAGVTDSPGVWGASRHSLTVGFIATMVFSIGQRVLPAFSGMRLLFSPRLMAVALVLLTLGCALRVSGEILAYQNYLVSAWKWLPVSAVTELAAVTVFAVNLFCTFVRRPAAQLTQTA